ncbi:MAG: helix-turn-helix domain-containing protein [Beijerinckiaceae bacterium]
MKKIPNPIDIHVGARVRMRRILAGLSQEKLGDALGITFQQIQKYEKGTNRIGASRLQEAAKVLGVSVNFFFEGVSADIAMAQGFSEPESSGYAADFLDSNEGKQLVNAFLRIKEPKLRKKILDLVEAMASGEDA